MKKIILIGAAAIALLIPVASASAANRCSVDGVTVHVTKWSCAKARPWIRTVKDSAAYGDVALGRRDHANYTLWWGYAHYQPRSKWVFWCDIDNLDGVVCKSIHSSTRGVSFRWEA